MSILCKIVGGQISEVSWPVMPTKVLQRWPWLYAVEEGGIGKERERELLLKNGNYTGMAFFLHLLLTEKRDDSFENF